MNPYQFLKQLAGMPVGGDGIRREIDVALQSLRTTGGLILTGATAPSIAAVETNGLAVVAAASSNLLGSFTLSIPKDYDNIRDELTIRVVANSAGDTDVPTLTCTAYRKRAGAALTAALTVVVSAAIANNTAKAAERTITLSGNKLLADDVLTVNLVSAAHTTDAINIYDVDVVYRGNIVFTASSSR